MADKDQVRLLKEGVYHWNVWRYNRPDVGVSLSRAKLSGAYLHEANFNDADLSKADLSGADLRKANFRKADLREANLRRADLSDAKLCDADLSGADLGGAYLADADFFCADLTKADLSGAEVFRVNLNSADLSGANLTDADLLMTDLGEASLRGANLRNANLEETHFVNTDLSNANLEGCKVYGVSAWGLILDGTNQKNLRITPRYEPTITVDDLEVAQFIYLMLNNEKVRRVINTITTKVVLILGRFTRERKAILNAIREELRQRDYLPIMFDFDQPATRDLTETISTLAHMARFIIADITDPRSIPQELYAIVPHLSVPVQPLLLASGDGYALSNDLKKYPWFLETHIYESSEKLVAELKEKVIAPAESKAKELHARLHQPSD